MEAAVREKDYDGWHVRKRRLNDRYVAGRESVAVISQLRVYDSRRLADKSGTMRKQDFFNLRRAVVQMLSREWPGK